ncbi:MAG: glycosidase [Actinobacteria bacterium]|nr:glycosidase [Actinomycetota bacterium]
MEPDPELETEAWGVLNPAAARDRKGDLYLFPRLVADGNYSRIGKARVVFRDTNPVGVERQGIALEPEESWERNVRSAGTEDPRITFLPDLDRYLLTYTAYGPLGPRIALAVSADLEQWERLGPASFAYDPRLRADLNLYPNKDAVLFPEQVRAPDGTPSFAMLHRPMWDLSWLGVHAGLVLPAGLDDDRPGIWVSFTSGKEVVRDVRALTRFEQHRLVALPEHAWEALKIGAGTPPLRTPDGWLILHHGVSGRLVPGEDLQPAVNYAAGAMLLDLEDVSRVVARSTIPLLKPETEEEREGIVPNVVFPTAIDARADGSADVYYGMADSRIGAARLRRVAE